MTKVSFVTKLVTVMAATSQFAIAVHVLALLAKGGEENVKSDCVAKSVNTNPVVIRRLFMQSEPGEISRFANRRRGRDAASSPAF